MAPFLVGIVPPAGRVLHLDKSIMLDEAKIAMRFEKEDNIGEEP